MTDVVDTATRSRMMSGIRSKNTKPELLVRSGLHNLGYRYRLHYNQLPGKPDILLPKHKAIILVNGCFWHGHECHLFKWPKTRETFWQEKIQSTRQRDRTNMKIYRELGWRVLVVWECALKGKTASSIKATIMDCAAWIESVKL
jgi:DNA mismatch endonuclease (patch repair protein)